MTGRLAIDDIEPTVSCGQYSARAVVGERLPISAVIFREGHDVVGANVIWESLHGSHDSFLRMKPGEPGTDRMVVDVIPDEPGIWSFRIQAWGDPYLSWHHAVSVKAAAGQDAPELWNDLEEGARILGRALTTVPVEYRDDVRAAIELLRNEDLPLDDRIDPALGLHDLLFNYPVRDLITTTKTFRVWVDRTAALYGSWYEFFPRSEGNPAGTHGTFTTAMERLPEIADMGFDVVYLPPIHPIGKVNRKGKNNTLQAAPDDVGSPWAIGSEEGGHDAIHPSLGTLEEFEAFCQRTHELGMEVALDLALQAAPDHPWVKEHPEWFTIKPDGSIAYAENPPKKYQDIYPINFDNDPEGIYNEVLRIVKHWINHGVKIFRVDNPHTKPVDFWHRLIWDVKNSHPDVLFLSEAFTRPAVMKYLAKVGFTQSYTYFTWRTSKTDLEVFVRDIVASSNFMRPNMFVNTPDILHASLQYGGKAMFKIRAALASTLSPSWGMYSGYELYEGTAVRPGSEEYMNSEKYQIRTRDWKNAEAQGETLAPYIRQLNEFRREHPALQQLRNTQFHMVDNEQIIAFSKRFIDPVTDEEDMILVVCLLDPHHTHVGNTALNMPELGMAWMDRFLVTDLITGESYNWGQFNPVILDPTNEPVHIFHITRLGMARPASTHATRFTADHR